MPTNLTTDNRKTRADLAVATGLAGTDELIGAQGTTALKRFTLDAVEGYTSLRSALMTGRPLVQRKVAEPFFGFNGVGGDTQIFTNSGNTPQGMDRCVVGGQEKVFIMIRTAGTTFGSDERQRIAEFDLGEDLTVSAMVAVTPELTLTHQGLGVFVADGQTYLLSGLAVDESGGGLEGGKGVTIVPYEGASTSDGDREHYQLCGLQASGHALAPYYNGCFGLSEDKTLLLGTFGDVSSDSSRTVIGWNLADVLAAGPDATGVEPVLKFRAHAPADAGLAGIQAVTANADTVFVLRGAYGAFVRHAIECYSMDGFLLRTLQPDTLRTQFGRDDLLDHATIGTPVQIEPEAIFTRGNDLVILMQDAWKLEPDIVTYSGSNWACILDSNLDHLPTDPSYWVLTTKADTLGAWSSATTYQTNAQSTRKTKSLWRIGVPELVAGESGLDTGVQNMASGASYAFGENGVDASWRVGRDFTMSEWWAALGAYFRRIVLASGYQMRQHDSRDGADNTRYARWSVTFSSLRRFCSMIAGSDVDVGAGTTWYGHDDDVYPHAIRDFTGAAGSGRRLTDVNGSTSFTSDSGYAPLAGNRPDTGDIIAAFRASVKRLGIYASTTVAHLVARNGVDLSLSTAAGADDTPTSRWLVQASDGSMVPAADRTYPLGSPTARLSNLYASGIWRVLATDAAGWSHTGDTTETTVVTVAVTPNNGAKGVLRITTFWSCTVNDASTKSGRVRIGGTEVDRSALASQRTHSKQVILRNRSATNAQVAQNVAAASTYNLSSLAPATYTFDMTSSLTITFTIQNAASGDSTKLEWYLVEVLDGV